MANQIINVPDIGSDDPVDVVEWLVAVGDEVAVDDSLLVLESAKASVEVPSTLSGKVTKILVDTGAQVGVGDALLELEVSGSDSNDDNGSEADVGAIESDVTTATTDVADEGQNSNANAKPESSNVPAHEVVVVIPDIGSDDEVDVIELLVAPGEDVVRDESLVVLESAKASVEVPSSHSGKLLKLLVKSGDQVRVGDQLAVIETQERTPEQAVSEELGELAFDSQDASPPQVADAPAELESATSPLSAPVHAGPAVRKLARQLGVDLAFVSTASGQHGRIMKEDVYAWVKQQQHQPPVSGQRSPALADIDFSQFGEISTVARTRLQRTAADNLLAGWQHIPLVTQHELVDITELEAFRRAENQRQSEVKLTMLAFVSRAVVAALQAFPEFNSSLSADGSELILKHYIHLGFAVETDRGLLVPVLKDADKLGVKAIAKQVAEMAGKARDKKITPREMQGAGFTITSLGGIGGTAFTPLVNHPQVAILGLSRADWQPLWNADKGEFEPRLMLPLSLSYDHRVIDGANAARFVVHLRDSLSDLRRLLL